MINSLELKNFRKFSDYKINLDKLQIIKGENATGKTSILEAIYLALTTKSFRTSDYKNLIKDNNPFTKISINTEYDLIEVIITLKGRKFFINKSIVKKLSSYLGLYPTIFMGISDLNLINNSPLVRREYLDFEIMQTDQNYAKVLTKYQNILKERNLILKKLDTSSDLSFLNIITENLVYEAKKIYAKRINFVNEINQILKENKILNDLNILQIKYLPNVKIETLEATLKSSYLKEIAYGQTLFGVHKDDYEFYLNNKNLKKYASNGEKQISIFKFKIAILNLIKKILKKSPLLLIDDLTNLLDKNNIDKIIDSISNIKSQVIISMVDEKIKPINNINVRNLESEKNDR